MKKVNIRRYGEKAYIQIENSRWLRSGGILAIVDIDKSTISKISRNFLAGKEKQGLLTTASMGLPKSFIVYDDGRKEQVILSVFSPDILKKRTGKDR